jgi:hypothetical protein
MGMAVEASIASRTLAELAAGAVDHDASQDEEHAGDTEQVREVLRAEVTVMAGVHIGAQMHRDVEDTGDHHHGETDLAWR